jgi:hypothetical protein
MENIHGDLHGSVKHAFSKISQYVQVTSLSEHFLSKPSKHAEEQAGST